MPTSSSHALFGGYAGAAVAKAGFGAIIAGALFTGGYISTFHIPLWVEFVSYTAISLGALRAAAGAAVAIMTATAMGVGISTTHTITGAIVGVGATRRLSAVRWGIAGQIVRAWILTIPAPATLGALSYLCISLIGWGD